MKITHEMVAKCFAITMFIFFVVGACLFMILLTIAIYHKSTSPDSTSNIIVNKEYQLKPGSHYRIIEISLRTKTIKASDTNNIWWDSISGHYGVVVDHNQTREFYPMWVINKVVEERYLVNY